MLQDPGEAHKGPWKVNGCTCQQFCVHKTGVPLHMRLGGFKLGSQAWKNSAGCPEVFRILRREMACP